MSSTEDWQPRETTTHQDHVIAHVVGATILGYFVFDETLYILLDIGFVWTIFLDGEMTLLPHPVAVNELEIDSEGREDIKSDIAILLDNVDSVNSLSRFKRVMNRQSEAGAIKDVSFFELDERRRLVLNTEDGSLAIDTSLATLEIEVYEL